MVGVGLGLRYGRFRDVYSEFSRFLWVDVYFEAIDRFRYEIR